MDEIDWIEPATQCLELHVDTKTYQLRESIYRLESRLDPAGFFRVHRSALVNLDRICQVRRDDFGRSNLVLQNAHVSSLCATLTTAKAVAPSGEAQI